MTRGHIQVQGCRASCPECVVRTGRIHLGAGLALAVCKVTTGLITRSKALAVSAMFALQDSISAGVVLRGGTILERRPSRTRSHEYGKVEFIVIGGMSILVFAGVVALGGAILHNLLEHRQRVPEEPALWAAVAGVVASWLMARQAECLATHLKDPTLSAHAESTHAHLIATLAVAAAVMLANTGMVVIDLLTALLQAAYVILAASRTLRKAVWGLMDASIEADKIETIRSVVRQQDPIMEVISVRATRSGQRISICVAVGLPGAMSLEQAGKLRDRIVSAITRRISGVAEVLVELRPARAAHGQPSRPAEMPG